MKDSRKPRLFGGDLSGRFQRAGSMDFRDLMPDTGTFPVDTGPTGGSPCMYCSTGTCPTPISDYSCLLNCLLDGYSDCDYDPSKSTACTCIP